jgi:transposase
MGLVNRDDGWRIPDWLWERIEPLLPPRPAHPLGCHNPRVPDRSAMDVILLVLRTGMQWNALNATGICHSSAAHRRFQEWRAAGVFEALWRQGRLAYDALEGIDWEWLAADGAMTKAPLGGRRPARIPPIERKGGEALAPHRRLRHPAWDSPRRRQPPRPQAAQGHRRVDPDRAPGADRGVPAAALPRQGL